MELDEKQLFSQFKTLGTADYSYNYNYKTVTEEDLMRYLKNPEYYHEELKTVSRYLYATNHNYKKLCTNMINLPTFDGVLRKTINPKSDSKAVKKSIGNATTRLTKLNLKYHFSNIMQDLVLDGCYFGYVIDTPESFDIIQIPSELCKITGLKNGNYSYSINFGNNLKSTIKLLPKDLQMSYNNGKVYEVPINNSIVIFCDTYETRHLPYFSGIMYEMFELQDYKKLKKTKAELDNTKLIVMNIPMAGQNTMMLDTEKYVSFARETMNVVDNSAGVIATPMTTELLDLGDKSPNKNFVEDMQNYITNATGLDKLSSEFNESYQNATITKILRQLENWVNQMIKISNSTSTIFRYSLLDVTHNNKQEFTKEVLSKAQMGLPLKEDLGNLCGYNINELISQTQYENDMLNLREDWLPLQSAHTQSGKETETPKVEPKETPKVEPKETPKVEPKEELKTPKKEVTE